MDAALKAIAEPSRRRILSLVKDGERSASEIASHFAVTRPAISQHLKVLREAGLVSERRDGVRRFYSIRSEGLDEIRSLLEGFWADGLLPQAAAEGSSSEPSRTGNSAHSGPHPAKDQESQ